MRNRSIARIILVNFFKTFGIIFLLIGVGIISYYLTILFLKKTARIERSTQYEHVIDINAGNESSNLIYSYDEKTKKIKAMVLELFDCGTKNLTYITIPANTQISISATTYQKLLEKSSNLPQLMTMSNLNEYFSGDVAYEYGIMILQEEYRADIGYFTALGTKEFEQYFEREDSKKEIYRPSKELLAEATKCEDEDAMDDLIEDKWDKLISNITLSQKQHYSNDLIHVKQDHIRTYRAFGSVIGEIFKLKAQKNEQFVEKIWEKKEYTSAQNKSSSQADTNTKATSVFIYNGSKITGLAAKYKQKLEADGYPVKGVGNAMGDVRTTSGIYAKDKKTAKQFEKYFNQATIEITSNMSSGADVEIVLGTQDDIK